jgi:putative phage-type endonuclease
VIEDLCQITPVWGLTHAEWLELRRPTIGGSDLAALAGLSKYASPFSVWATKLGKIDPDPGNEATAIGQELELSVARMFAKREQRAVVQWPVSLRSLKHEFASANLDFLIVQPSEMFPVGEVTLREDESPPPNIEAILECKTGAIASPGSPHLWLQGPTGESIPEGYQLQGMWYLGVTGLDRVEFAALIGGYGLLVRSLFRDEEMIEDLFSVAADFYQLLITETAPEPDGSNATAEAIQSLYPVHTPDKLVEGGEALREAWESHQAAKAAVEIAKSIAVEARARVITILGDAEAGLVDGVQWMTYRNNRASEKFDDKKFKMEHPDLWKEYARQVPGARVLRESKS